MYTPEYVRKELGTLRTFMDVTDNAFPEDIGGNSSAYMGTRTRMERIAADAYRKAISGIADVSASYGSDADVEHRAKRIFGEELGDRVIEAIEEAREGRKPDFNPDLAKALVRNGVKFLAEEE